MLTAEQPRTPPVPSAEHSTPIQTPSTPATTPKRETEPIKEIQPVERPRKRVKIAGKLTLSFHPLLLAVPKKRLLIA